MSDRRKNWLPSNYTVQNIAPYPRSELQNARSMLIFSLQNPNSYLLEQIKIKMGIPNIYGRVSLPPPLETNHSSQVQSNPEEFHISPSSHSLEQNITSSVSLLPVYSTTQRTSTVTGQMTEQQNLAQATRKRKLEDGDDGQNAKKTMFKLEQNCAQHSGTSHTYKCDLCSFMVQDFCKMQGHLDNGEHSSASLYATDGNQLLFTEQLHVVKKIKGSIKDTAFICPNCNAVFDDMFTCAMHNKYWHRKGSGLCCPCLIKNLKTVSLSLLPVCNVCHVNFKDHSLLNDHWMKQPDHCPIKGQTDKSVTVLFTCPFCSENFLDNFLPCKSHILQCHKNYSVVGFTVNICVKHLLRSKLTHRIPAFNRSFDCKNGLNMEIAVLSKLWQICARDRVGTRIQHKALTSRLNELTKLNKFGKLGDEKTD